ncbi:unnamed protein product [Effrenium voratum]|nr:unnamed protein product [Effrenium voratum]
MWHILGNCLCVASCSTAGPGDQDGGIIIRAGSTVRSMRLALGTECIGYDGYDDYNPDAAYFRAPSPHDDSGVSSDADPRVGSVLKTPMPKWEPEPDGLDMALDDLIGGEVIDLEEDEAAKANAFNLKHARVMRSVKQMGLTAETMHVRRAPQDKDGSRDQRGRPRADAPRRQRWSGGGGGRDRWSPAEKVTRWISWVVQAGYKDLEIVRSEGGWVDVAALAEAMARDRKDLGSFDPLKLKEFIQASDSEGRFEINGMMQLRKVPKDLRRSRDQRSPFERQAHRDPLETVEVASSASSGCRRPASPSIDYSDDGQMADDPQGDALAAECAEKMRVSGDVEIDVKPVKAEARFPSAKEVPKPSSPPGDHWTRFQDEGGGQGLMLNSCDYWWFYDGPLGMFWAGADTTQILPYVSDCVSLGRPAAQGLDGNMANLGIGVHNWMSTPKEKKGEDDDVARRRLFRGTRLCNWAGDLKDLPDFSKTRLCDPFMKSGACEHGTSCKFAHSHDELRPSYISSKGRQAFSTAPARSSQASGSEDPTGPTPLPNLPPATKAGLLHSAAMYSLMLQGLQVSSASSATPNPNPSPNEAVVTLSPSPREMQRGRVPQRGIPMEEKSREMEKSLHSEMERNFTWSRQTTADVTESVRSRTPDDFFRQTTDERRSCFSRQTTEERRSCFSRQTTEERRPCLPLSQLLSLPEPGEHTDASTHSRAGSRSEDEKEELQVRLKNTFLHFEPAEGAEANVGFKRSASLPALPCDQPEASLEELKDSS